MSLFITDGVRGVLRFGPRLRFGFPLGLRRAEGALLRLLAAGRLVRFVGRRLRLRPPPIILLRQFWKDSLTFLEMMTL